MLDVTFGWATLVSVGAIIGTLGLFWIMWLRTGYYEMPCSVMLKKKNESQAPLFQSNKMKEKGTTENLEPKNRQLEDNINDCPSVEKNLFRFILKMTKYLFFMDKEILMKDLGFEQMLFIHFMRKWMSFSFFAGVIMMLAVLVWAVLYTSNWSLVWNRLLGSRETTITSLDFDTFMASALSLAISFQVLSLRRFLASRLCKLVKESEVKTHFHNDIWYQTRTLKFKGLSRADQKGEALGYCWPAT